MAVESREATIYEAAKVHELQIFLDTKMTPDQKDFLKIEEYIAGLGYGDSHVISHNNEPLQQDEDDRIQKWKEQKGVVAVSIIENTPVVTINPRKGIPDMLPTQFATSANAGIYLSRLGVVVLNILPTYDMVTESYRPRDLTQFLRHELRHKKHEEYHGDLPERGSAANIKDELEISPVENRFQKVSDVTEASFESVYLDELHSMYFDNIEQQLPALRHESFSSVKNRFMYSIYARGTHEDVASRTQEGKMAATDIFFYLSGFIIAQRAIDFAPKNSMTITIQKAIHVAGAYIGTAKSLQELLGNLKSLWDATSGIPSLVNMIEEFKGSDSFAEQSKRSGGVPRITDELKTFLNL